MKIGVIGLGLIGGSIFKKLSELEGYDVFGVSRSLDGVPNVSWDYNTLRNCDIVFVCTPMNTVLKILDKLDEILPGTAIVSDVSSLKGFVSKRKYRYKFIPSHPMAGTEKSGWENSFSTLFEGAKWVVTPLDGIIDDKFETLEKVIEDIGAEVIITTPEDHDKAAALISHAPMVIAQALCKTVQDNKLAQTLASSGFRDTTRLALSNPEMAEDMVCLNKENIQRSIEEVSISLDELLSGDYKTQIKKIREFRENLYP